MSKIFIIIQHLLIVFSGLVVLTVGYPMWQKKVPPNSVWGFRTEATLNNPQVWYKVNEAVGLDLVVLGAIVILCSALAYLWVGQSKPVLSLLGSAAVLVIGSIIVAIHGYVLVRG